MYLQFIHLYKTFIDAFYIQIVLKFVFKRTLHVLYVVPKYKKGNLNMCNYGTYNMADLHCWFKISSDSLRHNFPPSIFEYKTL